jgi:methyltransferase (TIGR00027 family)
MMHEEKNAAGKVHSANETKESMRNQPERSARLASTAGWIAAVRAHEQERADRLFSDPWAAKLAGEEGWLWRKRATGGKDENEVGLVIRTRYFDDFLLQVMQEHRVCQVVILGAGMDTRAFRLHWPGHVHVFELDQPQLFDLKEPLLAACGAVPTCQRHIVPIDLRDEWRASLLRAGFDRGKPSVWLMEGLLFYLPQESVIQLFEVMTTASAAGSWLGCEVKNTEMLTGASTRAWIETLEQGGAPWISSIDHPEVFLAEYGWRASVVQPGDKEAHFGRWPFPVLPRSVLGVPRTFFVTATRNSF